MGKKVSKKSIKKGELVTGVWGSLGCLLPPGLSGLAPAVLRTVVADSPGLLSLSFILKAAKSTIVLTAAAPVAAAAEAAAAVATRKYGEPESFFLLMIVQVVIQ